MKTLELVPRRMLMSETTSEFLEKIIFVHGNRKARSVSGCCCSGSLAGLFGLAISSASTAPPPVCSPAGPGFLATTAALSASPAFGTKYSKNPAAFQEIPKASKELSFFCSHLMYLWLWQCCWPALGVGRRMRISVQILAELLSQILQNVKLLRGVFSEVFI